MTTKTKHDQKSTGRVLRIPNLRPSFPLVSFNDLKLDLRSEYVVKRLVPRNSLGVVWGEGEVGKTFWLTDLGMHVALNWEYRGHRVNGGPVVYCAFEGQYRYMLRLEAWRKYHAKELRNVDHVPFYVQPTTLSLIRDHEELIRSIGVTTRPPVMVVLDTLNRSLEGSESSDEDMRAYIAAADRIRETFDCSVIIVHHPGHEGGRPRGHSSLRPSTDFQIALTRSDEGNIIAKVERMKDGEDGERIVSRLHVVYLGEDQDGDKVTSCVVLPSEEEEKLTHPQSQALTALGEFGARGASESEWRARAYDLGITRKPDATQRAKEIAFNNAKSFLIKRGFVEEQRGKFRVCSDVAK